VITGAFANEILAKLKPNICVRDQFEFDAIIWYLTETLDKFRNDHYNKIIPE